MEKRYLTLPELCEYASLKTSTVYYLVFQRRIPFIKLTRTGRSRLRFDKIEIDQWLKEKSLSFDQIKKV